MAAVHASNGHGAPAPKSRFADIPSAITVAVAEMDGNIDVEISLDEEIQDDPTELCALLENERAGKAVWATLALAYAKQQRIDVAIEVLTKAASALTRGRPDDRLSILNILCWLYLLKCREAPRLRPETNFDEHTEIRTKDYYIQAATSVLNDASRINPSYPALFLARGVLCLLRASLLQVTSERLETLKQASKCFEDALRVSGGQNMMAMMGKARVNYSMGKYAEALKTYQAILEKCPELLDPDPRIGIGCCYWQLGHKDDARSAWQRSLDLNPRSKIAHLLLGLYHLQRMTQYRAEDKQFMEEFKVAFRKYAVPAFNLDKFFPLSCATLSGYYISRQGEKEQDSDKVETLGRRAIDLTDVNAIASDGWYYLARKEHHLGNHGKAENYYAKADQARGGDEKGYMPAKFGSAQLRVLMQDPDNAKFRLEKILQQSPVTEAQILLGTLYAQDVFSAQASKSKEDKSAELKKAVQYLEKVSQAWRDPKKNLSPETSVLLNLARLYETESPDRSLKCLEEVEQLQLDLIPETQYPPLEDPALLKAALRESVPPELLNNMGCFHYQMERFDQAQELFQAAVNGCVKSENKEDLMEVDALVTTISYNLGRTYEAKGMMDDAKMIYSGLLKRHGDYIEAQIRLAYIALLEDEGSNSLLEMHKAHPNNLEVRALYGWWLNKTKKRTLNPAEDPEQRHYKHTLQHYDKHDRFALTGMGNIWLWIAREMRRDTEQEKEKRRKMYEKAVEFFDKALQLDPRNAYAAQGLAIALIEDKKDHNAALQILPKIKDTIKDASVYINLGHVYCELKQYGRAIENYDEALKKDRARDTTILTCLGRAWFLKGKTERSLQAMKTALDYSKRALEVHPEQVHFKFNVAFVQIQIAQLVYNLSETKRTLADVEAAAADLDEAIESFTAIARSPNPPFPKNDIEQRANMGRNTMRRQLERAIQSQREYEERNAEKLMKARAMREAELRRREEERRKAEEAAAEVQRKLLAEQEQLRERDREYMEKRAEEERRKRELLDDDEARRAERSARRRGGGKRKKKDDADSETEGAEHSDTPAADEEERPKQKKRKLERKSKNASKFKSSEMVVDSDSEGEGGMPAEDQSEAGTPAPMTARKARVVDDDDDDE